MPLTPEIARRLAKMRACSIATKNRRTLRRLAAEQKLADILPSIPAPGMAYHVLSDGSIDFSVFASHLLKAFPFDSLLISGWVSSAADIDLLLNWVTTGSVKKLRLYLGEFADSRDPDLSEKCWRTECAGQPVNLVLARIHAKLLICSNEAEGIYVAMESSANLNRNSRVEQTVITRDRDLHDFYLEYFNQELVPIRSNPYLKKNRAHEQH